MQVFSLPCRELYFRICAMGRFRKRNISGPLLLLDPDRGIVVFQACESEKLF